MSFIPSFDHVVVDIWRVIATFAQGQVSPKALSSHLNNWVLKFWNHVQSCSSTISILIIYVYNTFSTTAIICLFTYIYICFFYKACLKPKGPNPSDFNTSLPVLCSETQSQHPSNTPAVAALGLTGNTDND